MLNAPTKDDSHKRNQAALRERANQFVLKCLMEKYDYEVVVRDENLKKIWDDELQTGSLALTRRCCASSSTTSPSYAFRCG